MKIITSKGRDIRTEPVGASGNYRTDTGRGAIHFGRTYSKGGKVKTENDVAKEEYRAKGSASSRLKSEAGSRDKTMKPTHLKGSAPVFKKKGGTAKKKGGKC